MTDTIDDLGPVDWIVVEFPGSTFNGAIAPEITSLVDRGLVKILDLLILKKDADGELEIAELSDVEDGESASCAPSRPNWPPSSARTT